MVQIWQNARQGCIWQNQPMRANIVDEALCSQVYQHWHSEPKVSNLSNFDWKRGPQGMPPSQHRKALRMHSRYWNWLWTSLHGAVHRGRYADLLAQTQETKRVLSEDLHQIANKGPRLPPWEEHRPSRHQTGECATLESRWDQAVWFRRRSLLGRDTTYGITESLGECKQLWRGQSRAWEVSPNYRLLRHSSLHGTRGAPMWRAIEEAKR